jgi:hypothetical protein
MACLTVAQQSQNVRTMIVVRHVPFARSGEVLPDAGTGKMAGQVRMSKVDATIDDSDPKGLLVQARPRGSRPGGELLLLLLLLSSSIVAVVLSPDGGLGAVLNLVHTDGDRVSLLLRGPALGTVHARVPVDVRHVRVVH